MPFQRSHSVYKLKIHDNFNIKKNNRFINNYPYFCIDRIKAGFLEPKGLIKLYIFTAYTQT